MFLVSRTKNMVCKCSSKIRQNKKHCEIINCSLHFLKVKTFGYFPLNFPLNKVRGRSKIYQETKIINSAFFFGDICPRLNKVFIARAKIPTTPKYRTKDKEKETKRRSKIYFFTMLNTQLLSRRG